MAATWAARYPGRCPACDERIEPGQDVTRAEDDQVVHADCEAAAPAPERVAPVCPSCWLTKPCGCDDRAGAP